MLHDDICCKCRSTDGTIVCGAGNAIFTTSLPINGFIAKLRICEGDLLHYDGR